MAFFISKTKHGKLLNTYDPTKKITLSKDRHQSAQKKSYMGKKTAPGYYHDNGKVAFGEAFKKLDKKKS